MGWAGLTRAERREVCANETLPQALVDAMERIYGSPAYGVSESRSWAVGAAAGQDRYVFHAFVDNDRTRQWAESSFDVGPADREKWSRDIHIGVHAKVIGTSTATLSEAVQLPYRPSRMWRLRAHLVYRLWWDVRMTEGCTAEAARVLLGLSVDTETLRHIGFTDAGYPAPID